MIPVDDVPQLGRDEIAAFLDRHYQSVRSERALVALYGTGTRDTIQHERFGSFEIVPVRSELDLREQMPALETREARIAFLVPWLPELPLDLAGRFSGNGKIWRIGREARLYQLFGVTEHEAGVMQSPLVTYLLAGRPSDRLRVGGGRLTLARMWEAWLGRVWSVEVEGGLALDTLLGWAALDGRGAELVMALQAPGARAGAAEVRAALAHGVAGQLGGRVGVAPRIYLKRLVDVLDRVDQHEGFDPAKHYELVLRAGELTAEERSAAGMERSVDDIELELGGEAGGSG